MANFDFIVAFKVKKHVNIESKKISRNRIITKLNVFLHQIQKLLISVEAYYSPSKKTNDKN